MLAQSNVFTITWDDLLNPYIAGSYTVTDMRATFAPHNMNLLVCPADSIKRTWLIANYPRSYSIVRVLLGGPGAGGVEFAGIAGDDTTFGSPPADPLPFNLSARVNDVEQPDATIVIAEAPSASNSQGSGFGPMIDRPSDQTSYSGFTNTSLTPPKVQSTTHGSKWNYVMADGHVEFLAAASTIGTGTMSSPKGMWTCAAGD